MANDKKAQETKEVDIKALLLKKREEMMDIKTAFDEWVNVKNVRVRQKRLLFQDACSDVQLDFNKVITALNMVNSDLEYLEDVLFQINEIEEKVQEKKEFKINFKIISPEQEKKEVK